VFGTDTFGVILRFGLGRLDGLTNASILAFDVGTGISKDGSSASDASVVQGTVAEFMAIQDMTSTTMEALKCTTRVFFTPFA
jgi:hypothetical protein